MLHTRSPARTLTLLLVTFATTTGLAEERPGIAVSGPIASSELVALAADGGLVLAIAGKRTTYAPDLLVSWGQHVEARRGPLVVLADGSLLAGDPLSLTSEELRIDTRLLGELGLPRQVVRGVIFRLPAEAAQRDKLLARLQDRREGGDWLLLANGDELTGRATGQKPGEGGGEDSLVFAVGEAKEPAALPLSKLAAVAFDSVLVDDTAPRARHVMAGLRDGSQLAITTIATTATRYDCTLASGVLVRLDSDALATDLTFWQPLNAGVAYLSDRKDAGYKHIPFLTQAWPLYKDRNCHGARLRAGGALYFKGLGTHTTSRIAYELTGAEKQFAAELALDESAGERGSVIFRVFTTDDGDAWKTAYESPVVRGGAAPLPMRVDLRGAKRLALIVDFADRGDECDDADWLNARLK
jgi:hypothetical protein